MAAGTLARDTAEGRARIAATLTLFQVQGGSRIARVRTEDGRQGLKDFEIARLREWCLENEEPWQPRWYGEEPVGAASGGVS